MHIETEDIYKIENQAKGTIAYNVERGVKKGYYICSINDDKILVWKLYMDFERVGHNNYNPGMIAKAIRDGRFEGNEGGSEIHEWKVKIKVVEFD